MTDLLRACGLPAAWAGSAQWRILDTAPFQALRFLRTWQAWRADPQRPRLLHVVAVAPSLAPSRQWLAGLPADLQALGQALADAGWGLVPGMHRLAFEGGQVLLTLCVGPAEEALRELSFAADSVWLAPSADAPVPARALARLSRRGTRLAAAALSPAQRHALASAGFALDPQAPLGCYEPAWTPKAFPREAMPAGRCVVVGGGLAGAAVADALVRRGWEIEVLDLAAEPAAGASGLPAGLLVPHLSPDDNLLSRLSRLGIRTTLNHARALLVEGQDWQGRGVLEHRVKGKSAPLADEGFAADWSRRATPAEVEAAGLAAGARAAWHGQAAWIRPAALVRAWLSRPGIVWRGGCAVARLERDAGGWRLLDAGGRCLAQAPRVVLAAALGSAQLSGGRLGLQAVRGQVSWGTRDPSLALPAGAVNGNGYLLPWVPTESGPVWMTGATYGRGETDLAPRSADHAANLARLQELLPQAAQALAPAFAAGRVQAWCGVRCASHDRRPLVGELEQGLWVCTAMGSRGLSFAALCAELLAAQLHGEPLPLPASLAGALALTRLMKDPARGAPYPHSPT